MNQTGDPIKTLVTGCSGFIGSHLASALIKKGWQVYALVRQTTDTTWLEEQKINLVYGDYTDADSLEKAAAGMDYVFHLGALLNSTKWEHFYRANTLATGNLLAACEKSNPGVKRFVFVSSIAAAGPSGKGQLKNENAPCRPVSLYGKSKMEAEQSVSQYSGRLPVVIIRPPNVLGTRQRELESTLKLVKKRIVPLLGNGDRQTSICLAVITRDSPLVRRKDILSARNNYWLFDSQKIEKELGFVPTIDFEKGITDTISWYREQGIL
jgi:nucleoside-diphosphate-sugar epimerase